MIKTKKICKFHVAGQSCQRAPAINFIAVWSGVIVLLLCCLLYCLFCIWLKTCIWKL